MHSGIGKRIENQKRRTRPKLGTRPSPCGLCGLAKTRAVAWLIVAQGHWAGPAGAARARSSTVRGARCAGMAEDAFTLKGDDRGKGCLHEGPSWEWTTWSKWWPCPSASVECAAMAGRVWPSRCCAESCRRAAN
jgi:hypothetical protein